jgi:hypothetical protein
MDRYCHSLEYGDIMMFTTNSSEQTVSVLSHARTPDFILEYFEVRNIKLVDL